MFGYAALFAVFIIGGTALLSWPLGRYMKWAMDPDAPQTGAASRFTRIFQSVGGALTRRGQDWKQYMVALLVFNVLMFVVSFAILALQQYLPLNPDGMGAIAGDLIYNTAASFTSNTNLQHYSGESTLSYFSQLGALMWLQFVSAATGIAALAALARGLAGRVSLGNFFVDVQRASFLVLLPLALVVATLMVIGGMPMTFEGGSRGAAAEIGGVQRQTVRDWVAAFNAHGPSGLIDGEAPGQRPLLNPEQREALKRRVEAGPDPAVDEVVRWRLIDLGQWVFAEFGIAISKQTLSRILRRMGCRKLSARPRMSAPARWG